MKVYISIPITGKDYKKQREHADQIARSLSRKGYEPVNPFNIYAGKNPDYWDHICYNLRALADCDVIYLCEGWSYSCGCSIERDFALQAQIHGKKQYMIIYEQTPNP